MSPKCTPITNRYFETMESSILVMWLMHCMQSSTIGLLWYSAAASVRSRCYYIGVHDETDHSMWTRQRRQSRCWRPSTCCEEVCEPRRALEAVEFQASTSSTDSNRRSSSDAAQTTPSPLHSPDVVDRQKRMECLPVQYTYRQTDWQYVNSVITSEFHSFPKLMWCNIFHSHEHCNKLSKVAIWAWPYL